MGRISSNYIVQDGVIPRTALPQVMGEIGGLSQEAGLRVANVFHAGDGNLHPSFFTTGAFRASRRPPKRFCQNS